VYPRKEDTVKDVEKRTTERGSFPLGSHRKDSPNDDGEQPGGDTLEKDLYSSLQIFGSLRRQRRSRRSQRILVLLSLSLGVLVLAVFFLMRPDQRGPQIDDRQLKNPIPLTQGEENLKTPQPVEEKQTAKPLSEGDTPVGENRAAVTKGTKSPVRVETEDSESQIATVTGPNRQTTLQDKPSIGRFTVNAGSFKDRMRAERFMDELTETGYEAFVMKATIPESGTFYRVSVGRFESREEALALAKELREKKGIDTFVRELAEEKS
jgi:cell division septation protein DedD